ncbi:metallophosphoesterase family protein [Fusibacter bizertensis]
MKILVLSDIHSNYNAFKAAMTMIKDLSCDVKICLGDMIGYYNQPNEVLEALQHERFICIKGNHDKYILGELDFKKENQEIYGIIRHRDLLTKSNFDYLKSAYDDYTLEIGALKLHFCHTVNNDFSVYLRNKSDCESNKEAIGKFDYFFYGHTHMRVDHIVEKTRVINPGSIGQPRGNNKNPSFCVLDTDTQICDFYEFNYDVARFAIQLKSENYNEKLINILISN